MRMDLFSVIVIISARGSIVKILWFNNTIKRGTRGNIENFKRNPEY